MSFKPLKKILLAAALTLSCAFNTAVRAQAVPTTTKQINPGASSQPRDSIHKDFNDKGMLVRIEYYSNGRLNDGSKGEPALQVFNDKGTLIFLERYRDGKLNDGANGEPANLVFAGNGALFFEGHCKDSLLNDGVNGEPAYLIFNEKGKLVEAVRYSAGVVVKTLSAAERAAYQKQRDAAAEKAKQLEAQKKAAQNKRKANRIFRCY